MAQEASEVGECDTQRRGGLLFDGSSKFRSRGSLGSGGSAQDTRGAYRGRRPHSRPAGLAPLPTRAQQISRTLVRGSDWVPDRIDASAGAAHELGNATTALLEAGQSGALPQIR